MNPSGIKILYLTSAMENASMLERSLDKKPHPFHISATSSWTDAFHYIEHEYYDAVVSDFDSPESESIAAIQVIQEKKPGLPILGLAGSFNYHAGCEALRSGMMDLVPREKNGDGIYRALLLAMERKSMIAQLQNSISELVQKEKTFLEAQKLAHVGSWDWNLSEDSVRSSDELYRLLEIEIGSVLTLDKILERIHANDRDAVRDFVNDTIYDGRYMPCECRIALPSGETRWLELRGESVPGESGQPARMIGVAHDITSRKNHEEHLKKLSHFDELTGLYNRRGFFDTAEKHLAIAARIGSNLSLVFLDMDDFKEINDRFGHLEGDRALASLSALLKETFRTSDIIGRYGGDEFAVLLTGRSIDAHRVCERLQEKIDRFNQRLLHPFSLSISSGIAVSEPGIRASLKDLIHAADLSMLGSKKSKEARTGR